MCPQFEFVPIHRFYTYAIRTVPSHTNIVAEINVPSGLCADIFDLKIAEGGSTLEVSVIWPSYMTNLGELNAKRIPGNGDGTLRPSDSRLTSSRQGAQSIIRSYGD